MSADDSKLCISDHAGLVDLFAGEAGIGGGRFNVPVWNLEIAATAMLGDLPPLLRRVVLIG